MARKRFSDRLGMWALIELVSLACLLFASPGYAEPSTVEWLPGDARDVTRSTSASRDTAAVEAIVAPRFSVTLGSEFALIAWRPPGLTVRVGALALFGLESRTKSRQLLPAPGGDSDLWRGMLAYELAVSLDRLAKETLGKYGALEIAAGYYHESDHHTASNDPVAPGSVPDHPELRGRPQIGNFLAADLAARFRAHKLEIVLRHQSKLFVNSAVSSNTPFRAGTGDELILQLHGVLRGTVPFWSTAAEVLIATARPERRFVRSILGLSFPGRVGELRIYASFDAGAEKGLLISEQQRALGAGLRYTPFASERP